MHPSELPPEIIYEIASYISPVDVYVDGRLPYEHEQIAAMGMRKYIEDTMIRAWKMTPTGIWVWCPFTFEYYPIDDITEVNVPTQRHFMKHYPRFSGNWYTESRKGSGKMMVASLREQPIVFGERVVFDDEMKCLIAPNGDIYEIIGIEASPAICHHRTKKDGLSIH